MRPLRRVNASSRATYGKSRPTDCWGDSPSESVQNKIKWLFSDKPTSQIRRSSMKRKKNVDLYPKLKYGISVPKNTSEAYRLDIKNGNSLWSEAINKELQALNSYKTFKFVGNNEFENLKKEGFQSARPRMIFDVKQNLWKKGRLVIGGHMVDSSGYDVYASVMNQHQSRIIEVIAKANDLEILVGDIGNAYLYAHTREKIFTKCDCSFLKAGISTRDKILAIVEKALYGLPTSGNRWRDKLATSLLDMRFRPSKGD